MDVTRALTIVRSLADGVDPHTGEVFAADSPYQHPNTVRALYTAVQALEKSQQREKREQSLPANAGKSWDLAEDETLSASFDQGRTIKELAQQHGRTLGSIQSRLEKLGKLIPAPASESDGP